MGVCFRRFVYMKIKAVENAVGFFGREIGTCWQYCPGELRKSISG